MAKTVSVEEGNAEDLHNSIPKYSIHRRIILWDCMESLKDTSEAA